MAHRYKERIEELRDAAWLRQRANQVVLSDSTKTRIQRAVLAEVNYRRRALRVPELENLVADLFANEYRTEVIAAAVKYAKDFNRGPRRGLPLKRYLKSTTADLRSQGLSAREAAEALYIADELSPVNDFETAMAEESGAGRECEECNKQFGGFHFHSWHDCPLNPEND